MEAERIVAVPSPFDQSETSEPDTTHLRSIQGELLDADPRQWQMAQDDVDAYVDRQTDEVLTCRQRSRHDWPELRRNANLVDNFDGVEEDTGLFFRRLTCTTCQLNVRFEMYELKMVGGRLRAEYVGAKGPFPLTGPNGETYKAPSGLGTMTGRQVKNSLATQLLGKKSLSTIKRQVVAKQKKNPDLTSV